ncbi:cation transporter [Aliidiomarina halalkaliphila]|uniref:Cation transporter n=1 Tax=Aliidiomarina halalkaliphila TaxID=2593535 RepID=A0A552X5I7_9GAMM|nr:Na+/H+ antiporter subunit E [Aliidiomarina halalkaliphila]TRW50236.1 cation transporter [Aliidiomarina halalkaliphila]
MQRFRRYFFAFLMMAIIWWLLTYDTAAANGNLLAPWWLGVPVALFCAWLALKLQPERPKNTIRLSAIPLFFGHFCYRSLLAGVDVAWRTLHPSLQLNPGFIDYSLDLPEGKPRIFFATVVSLLPGTLATELTDTGIRLHVLDTNSDVAKDCDRTVRVLQRLFQHEPGEPQTVRSTEDSKSEHKP